MSSVDVVFFTRPADSSADSEAYIFAIESCGNLARRVRVRDGRLSVPLMEVKDGLYLAGLRQRPPAQLLEDANRRNLRRNQARARNDERLLERVLPAQHRMRDAVGIDQPCGHWRKFEPRLWRTGLVARVFF